MTRQTREQREIIAIVMAAAAGEASAEQLARISRLALEDDRWSTFLLELMSQEAWLCWHASEARTTGHLFSAGEAFDGSPPKADRVPERQAPATSRETLRDLITRTIAAQPLGQEPLTGSRAANWRKGGKNLWFAASLAAALLLMIGAALGALANHRWNVNRDVVPVLADAIERGAAADEHGRIFASYEARLIQGTPCVWAPEMRSRLGTSNHLQSGDSLNLIAGLAELELSWPMRGNVTLRLEGPAGLVLMSERGANLNYGKLIANVSLQYDSFAIETPVGRVVVTNDARIGVAVSTGVVEVHVFQGEAEVITPWASGTPSSDKLRVRNERSIRLSATGSGRIEVVRGPAVLNRFASQVAMDSDLLAIPDDYVAAVKQASPLIYWRFDRPVNNVVKNAMGNRYNARVVRKPLWVDENGNMTLEFGAGLDEDVLRAFLVADEPLKNINGQSYTIELWAKPSHYHLGTMVSLVSVTAKGDNTRGAHGALLELGGPRPFYLTNEHSGRVRFLHRDPPSNEMTLGTSCFSNEPYKLRKWQHIVAVKDKTELRLYVDAKQVASAPDSTRLSEGLELLVGQIDRERDMRPFVGQLDELAFYDRALSSAEIEQHYRLVRPKPTTKHQINARRGEQIEAGNRLAT
jgi:hypothetical protein